MFTTKHKVEKDGKGDEHDWGQDCFSLLSDIFVQIKCIQVLVIVNGLKKIWNSFQMMSYVQTMYETRWSSYTHLSYIA